MNIKIFLSCFILAFTASIVLVSCDDHIEVVDTSMKVGHILCTDGTVLPSDDVKSSGKVPIAVVFYVDNSENKLIEGTGLAAYLWDIKEQAFADSVGVDQGTSADFMAYDGNINSFALFSNTNVYSPMANTVFDLWYNGRSCYVPSVAEMRLMYNARSIIDTYCKKYGGNAISDDDTGVFYWTSTEVEGQKTAKAWVYSLSSGAVQEAPKTNEYKIRPIITLFN